MDGSDDYFTDDIVLDEQALAVLDEEEHKYTTQTARLSLIPPAKKQKTDRGWKPGVGNRYATALDDLDDLPEISVQGDGTYGLNEPGSTRVASGVNRMVAISANKSAIRTTALSPAVGTAGLPLQPRNRTAGLARSTSIQQSQPQRPLHGQSSRPVSSRFPSLPQASQNLRPTHDTAIELATGRAALVEELRQKMEELQRENEQLQTSVKQAIDGKLAREGEVAILRKSIQKTAQEHAAQVLQLKAAKEEANAKQVQIQREMKDEMERLKTQFAFKQHEFETSTRRPPLSVRTKRIANPVPLSTPMHVPSQIRSWNQGEKDNAGPSNIVAENTHKQLKPNFKEIPQFRRARNSEPGKRSTMLPGFENSFITSTPLEPEVNETRGRSLFHHSQFGSGGPPAMSPASSPPRDMFYDQDANVVMEGPSSPGQVNTTDNNVIPEDPMVVDDLEPGTVSEGAEEFGEPDWKEELSRIMLTHILPSANSLTFQLLLGASLLPTSSAKSYSTACARILETLASRSRYDNLDVMTAAISESLVQIAGILLSASLLLPLAALLNLLTLLIRLLPQFTKLLLSQTAEGDETPRILVTVFDIIRHHLPQLKGNADSSFDLIALGEESLGILELLCWKVSENLQDRLAIIARSPDVLSVLLDISRPPWFVFRSIRLLALLATYPKLFKSLVSLPAAVLDDTGKQPDHSKIAHIESLCSYLVEPPSAQDPEIGATRSYILMFFAALSISHADAPATLLESQMLIVSMILYLTELTTLLWEDVDQLIESADTTAECIRTLSQTVLLLHYLVFCTESPFNLRYKLHCAPHHQFNGVTHMFIVTFGRLSYADAPEWVAQEGKLQLEQLADMARDLLDIVVEGPESDIIWSAFHGEPPHESVADDDEIEARRLDANEV